MSKQSSVPSFDEHVEALGHVCRRRLLHELAANEGAIDLQKPGETIVGTGQEISLHHAHIPKLESFELVSCEEQELQRGPQFEEIEPLLELLDDHSEELPAEWL